MRHAEANKRRAVSSLHGAIDSDPNVRFDVSESDIEQLNLNPGTSTDLRTALRLRAERRSHANVHYMRLVTAIPVIGAVRPAPPRAPGRRFRPTRASISG